MKQIVISNNTSLELRLQTGTVRPELANGSLAVSSTIMYAYDSLSRLSKVTRPFTNASVDKDVTYTYDLHGWTTGITTNSFREELFYADGPGTPRYNGNISAMRWQNNNYNNKRGYKFAYDDSNRLTQATYGRGNAISAAGAFTEGVQYDAHGNITGITRYGKISQGYGLMDNLTLTYNGNRLTGVTLCVTNTIILLLNPMAHLDGLWLLNHIHGQKMICFRGMKCLKTDNSFRQMATIKFK